MIFIILHIINSIFTIHLSTASGNIQELDLKQYHWKNRIVLLFENGDNKSLDQQKAAILEDQEGIEERHLLVFVISEGGVEQLFSDAHFTSNNTIDEYNKSSDTLQFVLIGKDGGMKMSQSGVVPLKQLYAVIDAMPMRRSEIRQ